MCRHNSVKPSSSEKSKPSPVPRNETTTRHNTSPRPKFDYDRDFPKIQTNSSVENKNKYLELERQQAKCNREYKLAVGPDPSPLRTTTKAKVNNGSGSAYAEYKLALGPDPAPWKQNGTKSGSSNFHSNRSKSGQQTYKQNQSVVDNASSTQSPTSNCQVGPCINEPTISKFSSYAAACQARKPHVDENVGITLLDSVVQNSLPSRVIRENCNPRKDDPSYLARVNEAKLAQRNAFFRNIEFEREWEARQRMEEQIEFEQHRKQIKELNRLADIQKTCSYLKAGVQPKVHHQSAWEDKIRRNQKQRMEEEEYMDPDHFCPPRDHEDGEFMSMPRTPYEIYNGCKPSRRDNHPSMKQKDNPKKVAKKCKAKHGRDCAKPTVIDKVFANVKKLFSTTETLAEPALNPSNGESETDHPTNVENSSPPTSSDPTGEYQLPRADTSSQNNIPNSPDMENSQDGVRDLEKSCYMAVLQTLLQNDKIISSFYTEDYCDFKNCSICIISSDLKRQGIFAGGQPGKKLILLCENLNNGRTEAEDFMLQMLDKIETDKAIHHPKLARGSATFGTFEYHLTCSNCNQVTKLSEVGGSIRIYVSADTPGRLRDKVEVLLRNGEDVKYECVYCDEETTFRRTTQFTALPEVAFVVANRFSDESNKSLYPVQPSRHITLRNKNGASFNYDLSSIICHQGSDSNTGLYYTTSYDEENLTDCNIFVYSKSDVEAEMEECIDPDPLNCSNSPSANDEAILTDNFKSCRIEDDEIPVVGAGNRGCGKKSSLLDKLSKKFSKLYTSPELIRADSNSSPGLTPPKSSNPAPLELEGETTGIHNFGSSCFISSIVQAIANNKSLKSYLCSNSKCGVEDCSTCMLTAEISDLFSKRKCHRLVRLWKLVAESKPEFAIGQHDAQEYMLDLFARIETDKILNHSHLTTQFDKPMTLVLESTVICSGCQYENTTEERVDVINIPVGVNSTVQEQLTRYTEPELNTDFTCENCESIGLCSTIKRITKLPDLAIILLQRYNNAAEKDSNPIFTNEEIEFTDGSGVKVHYKLSGAIVHNGNYVTEGHYTSIILKENKVLFYNDDKKTSIKVNQIPRTSTYMLFYDRESENLYSKNPKIPTHSSSGTTHIPKTSVPMGPTSLPQTSSFSPTSPPSQTKTVPPTSLPKTSPPSPTKPVPPTSLPKTSPPSPTKPAPVPPTPLPKTPSSPTFPETDPKTDTSSFPQFPIPSSNKRTQEQTSSPRIHIPGTSRPVPATSSTHPPTPTPGTTPTKNLPEKDKKRPREESDSEAEQDQSKVEAKEVDRAFTPYATRHSTFNTEEVFSLLKKFDIKKNPDKVINFPPCNGKGGDVYIYARRCENDKDYCRDNYFGFVNDGIKYLKPGLKVEHYKLIKENTKAKDRDYIEGFRKYCYYLDKDGKGPGALVLIHYLGDEKVYRSRPHKLAKHAKPFVSNTKAAKIQVEQSLRSKLTPQRVLNKGITDMYQQFQSKSQAQKLEPVLAPRDAKQVYNINHERKLKGRLSACEVFNLLELALQDYGSMIHDIVLYPDEGYVFGDPANIYLANHLLKKCAKDPSLPQLLSYDTTFNLGDAYLSCLVMRNIYFEGDPLFPVMYLIHNRKAAESHRWLFNRFDKLTSFSKKYTGSIPIISDRESAIKSGIREILKSSAYVSCHNHLVSDIKVWLKKTNAKIDDINGLVKEIKCLLYSKTEEQFNSLYQKYSKKWDSTFHDYIETSVLEDIKTSTEFKYNKFAAFENVIPTNNLSESMNSKIKHFLSRNELPKDSLLLGLHQLQIEILRDFGRSYGSGGNFVPKKQFQNTSDSLQLPDYINLTQEEFMKLFQPARPQTGNPPQKLDHRVSQKALAKLAHAGKLVSFDISARCYNIRSPYKSNVNTVFFNEATHRLQCTCVSKSASKCYHIIAAELFDINKPDQEEKPRVYQLSALQKRFRKAIGRAGRKAPKPQDEDFVSLPAPTSIAAKRKPASQQSPLPKAAQLLKKAKQTNAQPSTPKSPATIPTLFTKLKQGIQSSKSKSAKERDQPASNSKDYTLCPYILDEFVDTLKPKKWIDGHVIDIALRLAVAKYNLANHVLILSHSINELAFQDAKNPALCCRINEQQPLNYNIILIPMSVKPGVIGYHWLLGVLILNTKNIIILDSLKVSNVERTADFKRLLKIAAACYISSGIDIDFKEFNCIFARDASIQRNGWDCGVFVIKNAEAIISKTNINYECESEKERLRIRDIILQTHISEESKIDPRNIYPKSTHRLLSERASYFIPKLDNITLEQRIRTQDVSTILAKDFTNSKLNWKKCTATNCKLDLNQSRHQEGCALCRRWVHYSCEDLHTDPQIHVDYLFCSSCLEKIRGSGPPPGVRIQQISDGSNIGNPITVDDRDEDKKVDTKTSKSRQQDKASKPLGGQKDVDDLSEDPMDTEQDQASTASSSRVQFPHPSDGSDEDKETKPFTSKSVKQDKPLNPLGVREDVDNLHEDPMDDEQDQAKTNSPLRVQVSHTSDASDDEMETNVHTSKTVKQEASRRHEGDGDVLDGDARDFSQESEDVGSFGDPVEDLLKVLTSLEGEIGTRCLLTQVSSDEELVETCNNLKSVAKQLTNEANYTQVRNHWSRLQHNKFLMFTKSQIKCIRDQLNLQLGELWLELKDDEAASRQFWNRSGIYHYVFRIHVHASLSKVDFNVAYEDAIKSEQALDDLEEQDQGKKDEFDVYIQDFDCLRPFQDLSTEVVHLSFLALIEKTNLKHRFLVLPFEFWKWSLMSQHRKLGKYLHRYNPLSYEFILVPVNTKADPNQPRSQWSLGIILIRNRQIMLMDSFANTLESREIQFVALVKIALSCFLTCGIDVENQFQAIYSQDCPKQRYSEDSGIFTIKNLAAILERTSPMFRVGDQDRCIIESLLKTYKNLVPDKFYRRSKEAAVSQNIMSHLQSRLDKIQKISNQEIRETKQIFENYFENVSAAVCSKNCSLSTENLENCNLCNKFFHSSCEVLKKPIRVSANYNFCSICFNDIETSMDKIKASMETYIEIGTAENKNFIYIVPPSLNRHCQKSRAVPTGQLLTYFRAVKPELHNIVKDSQDMELQNTFKRFKKVINLNMMFNKNQMDWLNAIINAEVMEIIERDKDNSSAYAIAIPMLLLFMKVHVYANINEIDFKEGLKDLEQMHQCRWIREDSDDDVIPGVDLE